MIKIQEAFQEPRINALDDYQITTTILYLINLVGVNPDKQPNDEQKMVLLDFIKSQYPTYTPGEFKIAFQMNITGKLGDPIDHYQSFDSKYFGSVIHSYNRKRNEAKKEAAKPDAFQYGGYNSQAPGYRPEDYFDSLNRIIHRLGMLPFSYSWGRVYPHLIKLEGEPTPERKLQIAAKVKKIEPESVTSNPEKMAHECKGEFVRQWFMTKHSVKMQEPPKLKTFR